MSENETDQTPEQSKPKPKRTWAAIGCGCLSLWLLGAAAFPFLVFLMMFIPFFFPDLFVSNGEHLPTAEMFSPEATNYSFSEDYMCRRREFDIPEAAFLKMCEEQDWNPVLIETLPDLPPFDWKHWNQFERDKPRINTARECPLEIDRYCRMAQPKHKDCRYPDKCKFDPTGLTDDSCFHVVSKGYYFEHRLSNGGGMYVLYDLSNGRFYSEWYRR